MVTGITVTNGGTGYTSAPTVVVGSSKEVTLKPAPGISGINFGVIPDPAHVGPQFIQIGNEGGILPAPAVLNDPANVLGQNPSLNPIYVDFEMNRLVPTFGNVLHKNLMMGPAERADVIVGGMCVLVSIMRRLGFRECLVSEADMLDGLIASQLDG